MHICFLTSNTEGPLEDSSIDCSENHHHDSILSGGAIWGLIRSAALEVDMQKISLHFLDTDFSTPAQDVMRQVTRELTNVSGEDFEVSFRGTDRFVRRLSRSKKSVIGDCQLHLDERGSFDGMSVVPLRLQTDSLPEGTVEVEVFAVGLNFKDVLNVLVPDEAGYSGVNGVPLPGSDFSGVVTKVSCCKEKNNDGGSLLVGDK
eukprot:184757-Ditylum_brightwellii.AAC.1